MNCIWITTDSFRQDHIHCYRPEGTLDDSGESMQVQTPCMDKLATESVMFDRMLAEALPTIPCRRAFFTGRRIFPWHDEPSHKGIYNSHHGWHPLTQDDVTLAEHLADQGYVTAMVGDCYHLMKPSMNFHRGFESFHWNRGQEFDHWNSQPLPPGTLDQYLKPGIDLPPQRTRVLSQFLRNHMYLDSDGLPVERTFQWAIQWLERNAAHDNFYLYIDTFSPHEPWLPRPEFLDLYDPDWDGPSLIYGNMYNRAQLTDREHHHIRARYAAMCTAVDHWIGKLLEAVDRLGLRDNTLVILVSDHGKIIGEFGHYGMPHQDTGLALNPVPCFVRHPQGENAGKRVGGWLYNIDITATLLALLGVEPKPDVEGQNIWPAITADAELRDHLVTGYATTVAAWRDDWLYLLNSDTGAAALYNLADDVHRTTYVADRYPSVRDELARRTDHVLTSGEQT